MSARDSRSGATGDRSTRGRAVQGSARRGDARRGSANQNANRRAAAAGAASGTPDDGLIIGTVPAGVRVTGVLLVLAALAGVAALFPTYLVVGGQELSSATGLGAALALLPVPVAHLAVGVVLIRAAVPKFGLAYAGLAGALALGQLLIEIYRGSSSTTRPGIEVLAGERVLTSSVELAPGWVLGVVALGLTVLAGGCALRSWPRTVMEDGGALDAVRSTLAGAAVLLGVGTVLCLALPAADVPDRLVVDPATGFETVVTQEGPQALLERPGMALLGGLLLAGSVVLCSVIAPSLRPRLGMVGGLLAITVTVLAAALTGVRDAASSPDLEWTLPGAGLLMTGLGFAVLTACAWRLRRRR
ncbi:MAG: hypothetical protein JWR82_1267 [Blastococcus sp.]|nr:hypothetical protein [Blastococcus sp.]